MSESQIVYSSVFGGFEKAWAPIGQDPSTQTILVTDSPQRRSGWSQQRHEPKDLGSARLSNRFQKMLFYRSLDPRSCSVYIDANVRPIESLGPLFNAFENSGADIGMYRHYARSSVATEAQACLARNKIDNPDSLAQELAHYQHEGFPDTGGMWEGSVIFKRHSSERLSAAMDEWWELYSRFQTRDQFSLPFVIWKHQLEVYDLDDHRPGREHYFVRLQHSDAGFRNKLARYLQARAPENAFWSSLQRGARILARP